MNILFVRLEHFVEIKNKAHQKAIELIQVTGKEVTLIEISRNISYATLKHILTEYYSIFLYGVNKENSNEKVIKQLSKKYTLPEEKIAKAILDYENYALGNDNSTDESDNSE